MQTPRRNCPDPPAAHNEVSVRRRQPPATEQAATQIGSVRAEGYEGYEVRLASLDPGHGPFVRSG